jgi:two-component system chemotaxis response regulator CheY
MANILIADDSNFIRNDLKNTLESNNHTVFEAEDGSQGVSVFETELTRIDVIICDINMPNLDGISMAKQIQQICQTRGFIMPPVFALTTETKPELKVEGKKAGVIAWIAKPFDGPKLLQAISTILKRIGKG